MQRQPQPVRVATRGNQGFTVRAAVQDSDFKHTIRLGCDRLESDIYPPARRGAVAWQAALGRARRVLNRRGRHGQPTCCNSPGATQR